MAGGRISRSILLPRSRLNACYRGLSALPGVESVAGSSFALLNSVVVPGTTIDVDGSNAGTARVTEPTPSLVDRRGQHGDARRRSSAARAPRYFLVTPGFFTSIEAQLVRRARLQPP